MKNKRPCVRGLKDFQKNGCPEKYWNGNEGCPAWKEYTIPGKPGDPPTVIKDCIDMLSEYWQFESLKLLEGNQKATESFRNGMCEVAPDGKTYPKADQGIMQLLWLMQNKNQLKSSDNTELIKG